MDLQPTWTRQPQDTHQYISFRFRLHSHPQDSSLCTGKYSKTANNPESEALWVPSSSGNRYSGYTGSQLSPGDMQVHGISLALQGAGDISDSLTLGEPPQETAPSCASVTVKTGRGAEGPEPQHPTPQAHCRTHLRTSLQPLEVCSILEPSTFSPD